MYYLNHKKQPIEKKGAFLYEDGTKGYAEYGSTQVYIYNYGTDGKLIRKAIAVEDDGSATQVACRVEERRLWERAIKEGEIREI